MKTRNDFVSNSSSSSYIVIVDNGEPCCMLPESVKKSMWRYQVPNKDYGCKEFGWQEEAYSTFADKLNWCGIILLDLYAACRRAELKGGVKGKKACKIDAHYNEYREKFFLWKTMLEKVCEEKFGLKIYIDLEWLTTHGGDELDDCAYISTSGCYIDHQSDIFEEPANGKMFASEEALYNFLAYEDSYIQCGNDNG